LQPNRWEPRWGAEQTDDRKYLGAAGAGGTKWRLIAEHGDAKLTDLLVTLADCAKVRSVSLHDRFRARYARYYR
jgi:hypothetical protein